MATLNARSRSCPCCGGSGRVPLPDVYAETLRLLREQPGEINGAGLARLAGCAVTTMNNRLVRLESWGIVAGRVNGRERLWSLTRKGKR